MKASYWMLVILGFACSSRRDPPAGQRTAPDPGSNHADVVQPSTDSAVSVLMVMVDTLRADRLGVAGYQRDGRSLTPRLDAFAATSTRFTHAYSPASNTPRSFPALMTSRLPSQISFHKSFHNFPAVLDDNFMLFEALAAAGLRTASVSSHFYFAERRNLGQGVTDYDNSGALNLAAGNKDYASPRIVPRVIARLEALTASNSRFAMFVHLFEPHSTYIEHPEFPARLRGEAGLAERYDYEIAMADSWIGKILDALDQTKLSDTTVVIILSDHGEGFGTHSVDGQRVFFHGNTLYDEILRVPLLIRVPGAAPSVRSEVVSLIDVAPTVLDIVGIVQPKSFLGRSLLPAIRGGVISPRPALAEISPTPAWNRAARALVTSDGTGKIIVSLTDERTEIYDLVQDPGERHDLSSRDQSRVKHLRAALSQWTDGLTN